MADQWTVFGGWGFDNSVLFPIFGNSARYIDTTEFLFDHLHNRDFNNWEQLLTKKMENHSSRLIAGWSLGAIVAAGIGYHCAPKAVVLLSPTSSFCRRESNSLGWRPSVVSAMRKAIFTDRTSVLAKFSQLCEAADYQQPTFNSTEQLAFGLDFLQTANLSAMDTEKKTGKKICLHGTNDKVIPCEAGRKFAQENQYLFHEFDGGHLFFKNNIEQITKTIATLF